MTPRRVRSKGNGRSSQASSRGPDRDNSHGHHTAPTFVDGDPRADAAMHGVRRRDKRVPRHPLGADVLESARALVHVIRLPLGHRSDWRNEGGRGGARGVLPMLSDAVVAMVPSAHPRKRL